MTTIVDFLRHGEPLGGSRYRGSGVDDPLSEQGWRQMWQTLGKQCPWQRVVSSPLQRCLAFARALGESHKLPVMVEEDFREVGFGSWEGLDREQVQARDPEGYAAFYRDPVNNRPAGAENLLDFGRRVAAACNRTVAGGKGPILVVAHAGVIRAVLGHVLQAPPQAWYRIQVDNAGISRIACEEGQCRLLFHNRLRLP